MNYNPLRAILILILLSLCLSGNTQRRFYEKNRVGGGIDFNIDQVAPGIDIRAGFPLNKIDLLAGLSIVPKLSYYPWFNRVHEFYIGSDVHLGLLKRDPWKFYALMNLSYNGFINHENNLYRDGGFSNFGMDLGVGASLKLLKCLYPYLELRFNLIWREPHISLGMMYDLKCDRRGAVPCSKIPPQPSF